MGRSGCSHWTDFVSCAGQFIEFLLLRKHNTSPTTVKHTDALWPTYFLICYDWLNESNSAHSHRSIKSFRELSCHTRWMVLVWTSQKSELQESWRLSLSLTWLLSLVTWWLSLLSLGHWRSLPAMGNPSGLLNFKQWRRVCGNLGCTSLLAICKYAHIFISSLYHLYSVPRA